MSGPARIAAFAGLLIAVFAGAALLGGAVDPSGVSADRGQKGAGEHGAGHETMGAEHGSGTPGEAPPGLQIAQDGYRLVVERTRFAAGAGDERVSFRVVDRAGTPVRGFEVEHDKRMHFIVARRDLSSFEHLHPTMSADGTWTTRVRFPSGGVYRVFADFKLQGRKLTLGADVQVRGSYAPEALPRPASTARVDAGLEVTLRAAAPRAGREDRLAFEVRKDGRVVNDDLDPYLGAKGHLVALRDGDLAYLHTHPEGDELAFMSSYPSAGTYRLWVQFAYGGRIHTAAFTQEVSP